MIHFSLGAYISFQTSSLRPHDNKILRFTFMNKMLVVVQLRLLERLIRFREKDLSTNAQCNFGLRNFVMVKLALKIRNVVEVSLPLRIRAG